MEKMIFTEAILRRIEELIKESEKKMDVIEKKMGYVPIEVQNANYEKIKEIIQKIDKDNIATEFYLEYDCKFPFVHNHNTINSYKDLANFLST